ASAAAAKAAVPSRSIASASARYCCRSMMIAGEFGGRRRPKKRTAAVRLDVALPPCMTSENLRCVQRGARLVDERRKRRGIVDREIGEDLPVHFDAGELQPVHERVVVHVVLMRARVDAHDPQATEVALLVLAIAVRVLPTALHGFLRRPPELAARAKGAARGLHDLLLPLQAGDVADCTRH